LTLWIRDHSDAVRGFLFARLRNRDLADELAQDVFVRAWKASSRYSEVGKERSYLIRIADRLALDRARRAGREVHLDAQQWRAVEPADPGADPSSVFARGEMEQQLAAAMELLTESQRRTLLLRFFGDLGFAEIAAITGAPVSTVLSHCRRGLEALRRTLVSTKR